MFTIPAATEAAITDAEGKHNNLIITLEVDNINWLHLRYKRNDDYENEQEDNPKYDHPVVHDQFTPVIFRYFGSQCELVLVLDNNIS